MTPINKAERFSEPPLECVIMGQCKRVVVETVRQHQAEWIRGTPAACQPAVLIAGAYRVSRMNRQAGHRDALRRKDN